MMQGQRFYRDFTETERWTSIRVKVDSTDLFIRTGNPSIAADDLHDRARETVTLLRKEILMHIDRQNPFLSSFSPIRRIEPCTRLVEMMYHASEQAGVGPMAAVAGAIAQEVGMELRPYCDEIIVENGGDIWLNAAGALTVNIFTGSRYFKDLPGLRIYPENTPCGICSSSGRIGTSFSYGRADTATVIAGDAALADALATEVCNRIQSDADMARAAAFALERGAGGVAIVFRDSILLQGSIEIASPNNGD